MPSYNCQMPLSNRLTPSLQAETNTLVRPSAAITLGENWMLDAFVRLPHALDQPSDSFGQKLGARRHHHSLTPSLPVEIV